jgi:hypothetical protein
MKCESEARTILKKLASDARERLRNGNYGNLERNNSVRQSIIIENNLRLITNYQCKKPQITIKIINDYGQDDSFQKKVYNLLRENSDTTCPLKNLIDDNDYSRLSDTQKQRYILDLADKYTQIRQNYFEDAVFNC